MKRKLSSIILTLLLLCLTPITALAEDVEIDGIKYSLVEKNKEATVIRKTPKYSGAVDIPSIVEYEGIEYCVTSIGISAFRDCSNLISVTIPNSVTTIGNYAFSSSSGLTSVTIPNSVTSIGVETFYGCTGLTSVTIPNSVTSIGNYTFYGCTGLTSVTISNSVTTIGNYAFYGCSGRTSVIIPDSVTSIGNFAFSYCSSLTSITIGNSVTSIGKNTFYGCSGLRSVTIPNSVTSIGESAFAKCSGLRSVTIPNSLTSIGWYAFQSCYSLTSITIPNSVTSIGMYAFGNCICLTAVTIGNGIQSIGSSAFASCEKLKSFTIYATSVPKTSEDAFSCSFIDNATLCVPDESIDAYKSTEPWSNFGTIKGISGTIVEKEKCATPTIHYADGKLTFECETEGATYYPTVTKPEVVNISNNEMELGTTYKVSVYAAKPGYEDSDVATAEIDMAQDFSRRKGDINNDGEINITDALIIIDIILGRYY